MGAQSTLNKPGLASSAMPRLPVALIILAAALGAGTHAAAAGDGRILALVSATARTTNGVPVPGSTAYATVTETDILYTAAPMLGKRAGVRIGSDTAVLTRHGARRWISVVATLPGGVIRARGELRLAHAEAVVDVVGGTGDYEEARGTLTVHDLSTNGLAMNTYRLR